MRIITRQATGEVITPEAYALELQSYYGTDINKSNNFHRTVYFSIAPDFDFPKDIGLQKVDRGDEMKYLSRMFYLIDSAYSRSFMHLVALWKYNWRRVLLYEFIESIGYSMCIGYICYVM